MTVNIMVIVNMEYWDKEKVNKYELYTLPNKHVTNTMRVHHLYTL